MIEAELMDIIGDSKDDGSRIIQLADEFRNERDPGEFFHLLESHNEALVVTCLWILEEIPFSRYNSAGLISRLKHLIHHKSAAVRFHVIGALFPALDVTSKWLLEELQNDQNDGVRNKAIAAMKRLKFDG